MGTVIMTTTPKEGIDFKFPFHSKPSQPSERGAQLGCIEAEAVGSGERLPNKSTHTHERKPRRTRITRHLADESTSHPPTAHHAPPRATKPPPNTRSQRRTSSTPCPTTTTITNTNTLAHRPPNYDHHDHNHNRYRHPYPATDLTEPAITNRICVCYGVGCG